MAIFWIGSIICLIVGYALYVSNKQETYKTAFFYTTCALNDGDDELDIMVNLMKRYNVPADKVGSAIFEAKAGNEDWFKQNIK